MTTNPSPAAFITGLFETHLPVANLELAMKEQERRVAFYWIGGQGKTVLGLWEKPPWAPGTNPKDQMITQHFAFEIDLADLGRTVAAAKQRGIEMRNFSGQITDVPSVLGWFPVASIYFNDPDGLLLEFLARLPGKSRPEIGVVSLDEWNRLNQSPD